MVYASIHLQREYKGKSVAVLPQTVVVPAGIPSLEPCLGVVGLNAEHLVAETRARIPETWAFVDHAVASEWFSNARRHVPTDEHWKDMCIEEHCMEKT